MDIQNNSNDNIGEDICFDGNEEIDISMNDNLSEEILDDIDDVSSLANNSDLFDRLLKDKRFIKYEELILDIKNKKKENLKQGRGELNEDDDLDIDSLNELIYAKTNVRYPKK